MTKKSKTLTRAIPPDLVDLNDLPEELIGELTGTYTDEIEDQVVIIINSCGGEATCNQILVGIYREFGTIYQRRFMRNKLYRISKVWNVPNRRGVYTTTKPKEPTK